nr:MAG TPA: hypothetical protein [Bacteriophage sp.]
MYFKAIVVLLTLLNRQGWELNPRHISYWLTALPLSYMPILRQDYLISSASA